MDAMTWCNCANALHEYWNFENKLYNMNMDMSSSPAGKLADSMLLALSGGDVAWAYDADADMDWLVVWASSEIDETYFVRQVKTMNGIECQDVYISDAADLKYFVEVMRADDWPIEVPERWREQHD